MRVLLRFAYALDDFVPIEGSDRAHSRLLDEWFEIVATSPDDVAEPDDDRIRTMTRVMLAERFKLTAETTTVPWTVSKLRRFRLDALGPRLRTFDGPCETQRVSGPARQSALDLARKSCSLSLYEGHLVGTAEMPELARYMSMIAEAPITDDTGLAGRFQMEMSFEVATLNPRLRATTDLPGFEDALRRELGLTLVKETEQVTALTIRHVEWPSPN